MTSDCRLDDGDLRSLRAHYAIGFAESAIRRALELGDLSLLADALELLEAV